MRRGTRGFSLTEALVSMALMALLGLFVISLFPSLHHAVLQSRARWRATVLAYDALAQVRGNGYAKLTSDNYDVSHTLVENGCAFVEEFHCRYVTYFGYRRSVVTATVSWKDGPLTHSVVVETVMVAR